MSVHTQFRWFLAGLLVMVLVSGPASRADTLVTKDGKQWQGRIVDEGESYTLIQPDGSKLSFPKDVVQEVISPEIKRPEYEAMLKEADLSDDEQVAKLAEFAAQYGLTEEQKKLLASAYSLRRAATEDESGAQRGLAAWCESFGLEEEAVAAELRADQLEFAGKLAGAGDDPDRLVELARWCKERGMTAELHRCLGQAYSERKREATTAQAHWELARWCEEWKALEWVSEQQRAAVEAAASQKNLAQLEVFFEEVDKPSAEAMLEFIDWMSEPGASRKERARLERFLEDLEKSSAEVESELVKAVSKLATSQEEAAEVERLLENLRKVRHWSRVKLTCAKAIYRLRSESAGNEAMAHARLSSWCLEHGLEGEAAEAESAALKLAPEDPQVRKELSYVRDGATGKWVKGFTTTIGVFQRWEFRDDIQLEIITLSGNRKEPVHASAGKQFLILHFLARTASIGPYSQKDYALVDGSGNKYAPSGLSADGGQSFMPIVALGSLWQRLKKPEPAIYFEVPESAKKLSLTYKGKAVLEISR